MTAIKTLLPAALLSTLALAPACAVDEPLDELAAEDSDVIDDGKADLGGDSEYTYFLLSVDTRKCVAPLCGGYWVERVNRAQTRCADGRWDDRCYVAELELADFPADQAAALRGDAEGMLLRGSVTAKSFAPHGNLGAFVATEVWARGAEAGEPTGVFSRVRDNGVRCITWPCPMYTERKLNSALHAQIAEVDLEASGGREEEIGKAWDGLVSPDGLIVAGYRYTVSGPGGRGKGRTATQFYRRVLPAASGGGDCFVGGCSGQVCSDQEGVITTCEWRPEYACYAGASCERQPSGECGWTPTPELDACLANPVE